jgi:hypothetical protein
VGSGRQLGLALAASALVFGCTAITGADDLYVGRARSSDHQTEDETVPSNARQAPTPTRPTTPSDQGKGTSQGVDAGADVTEPPPVTSTVPLNPLQCDGFTCAGEKPYCCQYSDRRGACVGANDTCGGRRLSCNSTDDCRNGDVCCADTAGSTTTCRPAGTCGGGSLHAVCDDANPCQGGQSCVSEPLFDLRVCN